MKHAWEEPHTGYLRDMKTGVLFLLVFSSCLLAAAQQKNTDTAFQRMKQQSVKLSGHITTLKAKAIQQQNDLVTLEESIRSTQWALQVAKINDPEHTKDEKHAIDSLNKKLLVLNEKKQSAESKFDDLLVMLDSCVGLQNSLNSKMATHLKH